MERIKAYQRAFLGLSPRRKTVVCIALALILALTAALCITINMRANIQREYSQVRGQIGEALYSNLYMLMQTFDMTQVPNANTESVIIPQMREYFVASTTLNDLVKRALGQRYAVLTDSDIKSINSAFSAYNTALASGSSTDLAQADMKNCMTRVRELLTSRFSEGMLKAAR